MDSTLLRCLVPGTPGIQQILCNSLCLGACEAHMRTEGSVSAAGMDAPHISEGSAAMLGSGDPRDSAETPQQPLFGRL